MKIKKKLKHLNKLLYQPGYIVSIHITVENSDNVKCCRKFPSGQSCPFRQCTIEQRCLLEESLHTRKTLFHFVRGALPLFRCHWHIQTWMRFVSYLVTQNLWPVLQTATRGHRDVLTSLLVYSHVTLSAL